MYRTDGIASILLPMGRGAMQRGGRVEGQMRARDRERETEKEKEGARE